MNQENSEDRALRKEAESENTSGDCEASRRHRLYELASHESKTVR